VNIRRAIFAGSWYPRREAQCEKEIKNFLKESEMKPASAKNLIGAIVPHAGWYFSGSIACNVIHSLKDDRPVDAIAIFGMHLHPNAPCYLMSKGAWETPFGALEIEENLADALSQRFSFKIETPHDYTEDNTIELQLPFIKYFFEDVKIVPVGLPPHKKSLWALVTRKRGAVASLGMPRGKSGNQVLSPSCRRPIFRSRASGASSTPSAA